MWFGILGPLEVRADDGAAVPVAGPRPRGLLVMLALEAGGVVTTERLIDGQYGDAPPPGAGNAIQAQVSRLRRALPTGLVEFHGTGYRLAAEPGDVDAHRFARLAGEGRHLLAAARHADAARALREALALWRGPALADLPHGHARAAGLDELRLTAAEDLVEAELALPHGGSVAEIRRLVAEHPLRERPRGQLMRALHAAGRRAEALEAFDEARRLLADELGIDPSPELAAIHLDVLRAERPVTPRRPGVAAQLTSFVGRDRELERLAALRGSRLVTIVGPGGTGKTRLAVEAAGRDARETCFVDLAPLGGGDDPVQAALGALGLRESGLQPRPGAEPAERLAAALGEREMVLVFDNCEHVVGAAAALARRLLAECPRLRVVATSREPLGLTGETLVPLAPLATPPPGTAASGALAYPAVRLFADRAAAVRPGFEVSDGNVAAVTEVCAALDGLPLGIELAAARLRSFTVEDVATRLAEHGRFRLLSRGDRTAAARHRTLRAVVEWSWDLLDLRERTLAARFAVFAGGASLEAVEAVCGGDDPVETLAGLVDKSLVEADGGRYRMLDTILLFCAEKLAESGEEDTLRARHAGHFLGLAQRADPHLRRAEQLEWLARLSRDHDNLMAALRWSVRADTGTALRLVAALGAYWWLSGRRGQAGAAAADLLGTLTGPPDGLEEEYVACVTHAVPRASPGHWNRAVEVMRTLDRPLRHPFLAALWGMVAGPSDTMDPEDAERVFGQDAWTWALALLSQGLLAVLNGEPAEGERVLSDVLARFRGLGERWGTAQALDWLALIAGRRGEGARARVLWSEALGLFDRLGALEESVDVLARRADCLLREGDPAAAAADLALAEDLARTAGQAGGPAVVLLGLGELARHRGDLPEARRRLGEALRAAERGSFATDGIRARVLAALARVAREEGRPEEARSWYHEARECGRTSVLASDLADAADAEAEAALLDGDGARAARLLGAAVALRGTTVAGDRDVARAMAAARALLGPSAFTAVYAQAAAFPHPRAHALLTP
ncbi:SARP family transcriptional regulator [Sphaerisporangium krabiense]|uniref:Putative ATPase/DNA-binding SARP family transcriptional activator n=1 Tax=Sphaerisporangium krabiense TaxID=763782 RepID=A0A7W8Z596_9ACTN|nr:BTAD domain-containing putative transcriptional regulator [Sphaerisporangium krabiense]MBB5627717.1 putative ATPase/DNA-binding SARP family transcriptional activator [Sphaerisporangium krabiense]GII61875.1 SARP family transcriptional regulator [Sphaerisporangium krabiense]